MVKKHPWERIDPLLFSDDWRLIDLAKEHGISYRSVTNRKYQVRDRLERKFGRKLSFGEIYDLLINEKKGRKRDGKRK